MLSIPHMIVVFIVVLVVFGPQKLPELARGLGKLMAEFRKASMDFKSAFEQEMRDLERQSLMAERKKAAEATAASTPAEPLQSAALATTSGDGTSPAEPATETLAPQVPVISPVAESVPRSPEEPAEIKTETVTAADPQSASQDTRQPA